MSSWLPSPFSLFTFRAPVPTSPSSPSPAVDPSPTPARRLPAPPLRGSDFVSEPASGFKREREDTGGSDDREDGGAEQDGQGRKRRKGMLGTALSTALDAAIFSAALSYSAYQLWRQPPTSEELELHLCQKRLTDGHDEQLALPSPSVEAPPPYSAALSPRPQPAEAPASFRPSPFSGRASPSQIPRRAVRHVHEPRPRSSLRSSSVRPTPAMGEETARGEEFTFAPPAPLPQQNDPFAALLSRRGPLPEFQPYNSPRRSQGGPPGGIAEEDESEEDDLAEDDEMRAVGERLRSLIETGRDALVARPAEWDAAPLAPLPPPSPSSSSARTRMSTGGSTASFISSTTSTSLASPSSSSLSRARPAGTAPRHSLPSFARPTASSSSAAAPPSPRGLPLSPPPPRSPRFSTGSASQGRRRQSVDLPLSPSSSRTHGSQPGSPRFSHAPSSGLMRRAATAGHARMSSVGGSAGRGAGGAETPEGHFRR
ncbi:hypothetical protein JCM10213_001991 [Rhodosporidiobolus nylandii]